MKLKMMKLVCFLFAFVVFEFRFQNDFEEEDEQDWQVRERCLEGEYPNFVKKEFPF